MPEERTTSALRTGAYPWGKLGHDQEGRLFGWRSLVDHNLDVAAVINRLLRNVSIRARLARLGGLDTLSEAQCDRLAYLAALHDVGKANHGFQNKASPAAKPRAGHLSEVLAVVQHGDHPQAQRLIGACRLHDYLGWFDSGAEGLIEALHALFYHHGAPVTVPNRFPQELWAAGPQYDPITAVANCVDAASHEFPGAFEDAEVLPSRAAFLHGFLGLLTLADWIASDERSFPLDIPGGQPPLDSGESRDEKARQALDRVGLTGLDLHGEGDGASRVDGDFFEALFGVAPRPAQSELLEQDLPADGGSVRVLEADTGSGKTEAALGWFLRLHRAGLVDGLYFALPTRAAAAQIHARVRTFARSAFGEWAPEVILAVPGYTPPEEASAKGIESDGRRYSDTGTESDRSWAAEHPKRYLAGRLVVGTIDQVLLSGLQVKHSHLRAAGLLRNLLVVDEVHASDAYMARILEGVLSRHSTAGGHALLLSATLGATARTRVLAAAEPTVPVESAASAEERPYPALWTSEAPTAPVALTAHSKEKRITVGLEPALERPEGVAHLAAGAAGAGARVVVLRNTVTEAVATQWAVEALAARHFLFRCEGRPAPHHGRFAREDRLRLDQAVETALGEGAPVVVVATQTLEQSLDIDFDYLVTDLCPIDVLLQRLGRLHRHARRRPEGYETPQVCVLTPEHGLEMYLDTRRKGRRPGGLGTVYEDLLVLEGTRAALAEESRIRVPTDNRRLIERVLHESRTRELAESLGSEWLDHWSTVRGYEAARASTASLNTVDWSLPLSRTRFNAPGEVIRTRLGADSRRLVLPGMPRGPFGMPVGEVVVPDWMAGGLSAEPEIEVADQADGRLLVKADERRYVYDRFGLRTEES